MAAGNELALIADSSLVITHEDGSPAAVVIPGTGEIVSLDDLDGLMRWRRTISDLKYDELRPIERLVDDAIYAQLDQRGVWSYRTDDGLVLEGESRGTWEGATEVDAAALRGDVTILRKRDVIQPDGTIPPGAVDEFLVGMFKVEITLTAEGRRRLVKMGGAYAEALAAHTRPVERARKAPSVRRAK